MNLGADYRVSQVCRVLELPRRSYYYQTEPDTHQRSELVAALQRLAAQWSTDGYRRLTVHLHREGYRSTVSACEGLVGEPTQNGYAERLMPSIKEEHVNLTEYVDYQDAYQKLGRFLDEAYMLKRIHSSLGYLTPMEFESQWGAQQQVAEVTHFQ